MEEAYKLYEAGDQKEAYIVAKQTTDNLRALGYVQTEAQASVYVQKMTTILHARGGVDPQQVKRAT